MQTADSCPLIANERNFDDHLKTRRRTLALIYAAWCPYCQRFLPVFKKYAQDKPDLYLLAQDDREILQDRYGVDVIPTVLCFEDGKPTRRLGGKPGVGLTENQLAEFIRTCGF